MWIYRIATGEMVKPDGTVLATGYSGHDPHKNDPTATAIHDIGPIPCGEYSIGAPYNTSTHGPHVLRLTAAPEQAMYGRGGFLIHGDSIAAPGTASMGCVVLGRAAREAVWQSNDHVLRVVRGDVKEPQR